MGGRLLTLACSASIYAHSSPFCAAFLPPLSLSLSNELVTFFISSNSPNTAIVIIIAPHCHPSSSLVLLLITTYHSLLFVSMLLFIIAFVAFGEQYFLYALPSSALITRTTHTFFRNFTRTHIFLLPAYLNDRNKQKGFRSRTAVPRLGPQRWIRIICMTPRLVPPPGAIVHIVTVIPSFLPSSFLTL